DQPADAVEREAEAELDRLELGRDHEDEREATAWSRKPRLEQAERLDRDAVDVELDDARVAPRGVVQPEAAAARDRPGGPDGARGWGGRGRDREAGAAREGAPGEARPGDRERQRHRHVAAEEVGEEPVLVACRDDEAEFRRVERDSELEATRLHIERQSSRG